IIFVNPIDPYPAIPIAIPNKLFNAWIKNIFLNASSIRILSTIAGIKALTTGVKNESTKPIPTEIKIKIRELTLVDLTIIVNSDTPINNKIN
ncbi:hypothetical protein, partial [Xenorhabdus bovienii]|uniref:hypothetical protein n=1 Tax=Xenorhabdus bovienii TaxID=40576 RepID=UPI0023B28523